MSRQFPIYISESEEEPEYASDEVVSETEHSPVDHRATSDGTIDTSPPLPPTDPNNRMLGSTFMNARHLVGESSRGPGMCRTARMSVRAPPVGPLAPRDKEPMTNERKIPCDQPSQQGVRVPHLDWMPRILHHWRTLERIPSTFETGESSHSPTPFHLTREPLELTIPTVVAVIRTLLGFHYGTQDSIRELHSDASRLDGDVLNIYGRIATSEVHIEMDREFAVATRARLIMLERRASAVGAAVGICVLMAAIRMVVGWCLPYFQ